MKLRTLRGLLFLAVAVLVVTGAGCPNSTPITSGNGKITLGVFSVNQGRWDSRARIQIDTIQVLPMDPAAVQALGFNSQLVLRTTPLFVDLTRPEVDAVRLQTVDLPEGMYEVVRLRFSSMVFFASSTDTSTCEGAQGRYTPPGSVTITNFTTPLTFNVQRDTDTMISLTFDVTALTTALNMSYTCPPGPPFGSVSNTTWNANTFGSLYDTFLTLD